MWKLQSKYWVIRWGMIAVLSAGTIVLTSGFVSPVQAQFSLLQNFNLPTPDLFNQNSNQQVTSGCIRLDGRCVFKIAAPKAELEERIKDVEQRLNNISELYLRNDKAQLRVVKKQEGNLPNIYISVGDRQVRLMSVTDQDAKLTGASIETRADELVAQLQQSLEQAKQERQVEFLARRGGIAAGTGVVMLVASISLHYGERRLKRSKEELAPSAALPTQPISTQLTQKQQWNVKEVEHRLFQLIKAGIWVGGTVFILGLFPHTRMLQVWMISSLRIPLQLGLITVGTYVIIRLSYALIDKFASAVASNYLLTPEANRRLQLRLSTISSVSKGILTLTVCSVAILVALSSMGVNIGPVLAGAGIIGVGLSLASQSLIKDALNGFFIILEDQYAVGDVINVAEVGGLVENMNLRITQLRDAEGRLITIPNSEIKVVANLSSNWSRADLSIPIAYYTDVDKALEIIGEIAQEMSQDELWREQIVEKPQVLGVDDFGIRGVILRVWIKTQPLKQWDVAREFRRRLKVALDKAGISIPMPPQEVWFNNSLPVKSKGEGQGVFPQ
ncbi:MAG TPA: mechanosensitive ion channel family protein [Waterburya sp.]|jgi:small conductance mechanosensitive channel